MEFFGLIGEKLGHSLSEKIHTRLFELLSLPAAYRLMEIPRDRLCDVGGAIRLLGLKGINVTIPYKELVISQLDTVDEYARALGAVNTIKNEGGRLVGYNTDVHGLKEMFRFHGINPAGRPAAVLGSGGAAKAAIQALAEMNAGPLYVASRSPKEKSFPQKNIRFVSYAELGGLSGGVLVNATPVGMWPHTESSPVPAEVVANFQAVADTIYNPPETRLLALAGEQGKARLNGLYMLVAQAVRAEEIFWDTAIPESITAAIYRELAHTLPGEGG